MNHAPVETPVPATVAAHIPVVFEGPGAGIGPLSWGQIESWNAVTTLGHWMPIGGALPVRPGTTVEDLAGELRHHLSRHPSLRTLLRIPAGGGTPTQEVHASGSAVLQVYETGGADPSAVADLVAGRFRDTPLDFTAEYPIRMAAVLHDGVPSHVVALISHFAADGAGAQAMLRDVAARPAGPVDGRQPLDQAQWQRSPAGRRQNEAAQRHFESILRTMPPARFRKPLAARRPRYWRGVLDSAALPLALRALTARTGADPSAVLLAVFALAVHATCGVDPVVVRPLVSNRFRPGLADVVCTAVQAGLCQVPVGSASGAVADAGSLPGGGGAGSVAGGGAGSVAGGGGFEEVLAHAKRATMSAYKHAYFDQRDLFALVDRVGAERGERLEIGCFLNDRRDPSTGVGSPTPTAAEIAAALPRTVFDWTVRRDAPGFEPMILDVEDTPGGLRCTAHTDTAHISPADTSALLHHLERIAVTASGSRPA
ncbi:condensation domain-containing protein [Dactylosporangium sp. NPDC000521]|uniref:condensation domain-containing protein n=1 Tax=Dactylosporangium sp. NPDC000521 TaxID=3363975 RepID=UPI0036C2FB7E